MKKIVILVVVLLLVVVAVSSWARCRETFPSDGMKLVFQDNFSGTNLDTSKWDIFTDTDPTHSCAVYENPGQISVNNGLTIAIKAKDGGGYTSGRIESKQQFVYGYFEAKIKINGYSELMWPAFWLAPNQNPKYGIWPKSGEIDIMETVNAGNQNISTLHCNNTPCQCGPVKDYYCCGTASNGVHVATANNIDFSQWHTFGCLREQGKITIYVDGNMVGSILTSDPQFTPCWIDGNKNSPFDAPMNIILNLAIGGDWAAAVSKGGQNCKCTLGSGGSCIGYAGCTTQNCPGLNIGGNMQVAYVKVWQ